MCSEFRDYHKELNKCGFRYKISDRDETDFLRLKFSYYFTTFMNDLDKYLLVINKIVRTEFFCTYIIFYHIVITYFQIDA